MNPHPSYPTHASSKHGGKHASKHGGKHASKHKTFHHKHKLAYLIVADKSIPRTTGWWKPRLRSHAAHDTA